MSLSYVSAQLTVYVGCFLMVSGILGNGMNILVLSAVRLYRRTPCTFYFLTASVSNIIYVMLNLTTRILSVGFGIDPTRTSVIWCKIRSFSIIAFGLISLCCTCLASIDQYLVTSRNANYRRHSNIIWAHRAVLIVIIVSCLHGILPLYFQNISPVIDICVNMNAGYTIYNSVYLLTLGSSIPILIMVTFGYLTYRNIRLTRNLAEQQIDRQAVKMTLIQMILLIVCLLPYVAYTVYSLITSTVPKDSDRLMKESFALSMIALLTYGYYCGSCYMFIISSRRFRQATKDQLFFWRKRNQIVPIQRTTHT